MQQTSLAPGFLVLEHLHMIVCSAQRHRRAQELFRNQIFRDARCDQHISDVKVEREGKNLAASYCKGDRVAQKLSFPCPGLRYSGMKALCKLCSNSLSLIVKR